VCVCVCVCVSVCVVWHCVSAGSSVCRLRMCRVDTCEMMCRVAEARVIYMCAVFVRVTWLVQWLRRVSYMCHTCVCVCVPRL